MKLCRNCGDEGTSMSRLRKGYCPTCAGAIGFAFADLARAFIAHRAHLKTFGDESGDAAADAITVALRHVRRLDPTITRRAAVARHPSSR